MNCQRSQLLPENVDKLMVSKMFLSSRNVKSFWVKMVGPRIVINSSVTLKMRWHLFFVLTRTHHSLLFSFSCVQIKFFCCSELLYFDILKILFCLYFAVNCDILKENTVFACYTNTEVNKEVYSLYSHFMLCLCLCHKLSVVSMCPHIYEYYS